MSERLLRPQLDGALLHYDHALFAKLVADVDTMYANANVALAILESGAPRSSAHHDWRVRQDPGSPTRLEMVLCEEFPFPKVDVDSAIHALIHRETPGFRRFDASVSAALLSSIWLQCCILHAVS